MQKLFSFDFNGEECSLTYLDVTDRSAEEQKLENQRREYIELGGDY